MAKEPEAGAGKKATEKKEKARADTEAMKKWKKEIEDESEEDEDPPLKIGRRAIKSHKEALYKEESNEDIHPENVYGGGQIIELVGALQHNFV